MGIFDFEVRESVLKMNSAGFWNNSMDWEHFLTSVSISSNLIQETIFVCDPNSCDFVSYFIDALESLATQSKTQPKKKFLHFETVIKKLARVLEVLNQRGSHSVDIEVGDDNSRSSSKQFQQIQKNHLIDLEERFKR